MTNSRTTEHEPADIPRGRRLSRRLAPLAALVTGLGSAAVALAPAASAATGSATYVYTGAEQTFVVPAGVTSIHVAAVGGRGGSTTWGGALYAGGWGAEVSADLDVDPGQTLYLEVGGNGGDAANAARSLDAAVAQGGFDGGGAGGLFDGSGGGGATDVRTLPGSDGASLGSRLLVAGGGGGAAIGSAGGSSAENGSAGSYLSCSVDMSGGNGGGADAGAGGAGGSPYPSYAPAITGASGRSGSGGAGGAGVDAEDADGGGGGGGGYVGGGGGGGTRALASCGGAGGGGSSYVSPTAGHSPSFATDTTGVPTIVISWAVGARPLAITTAATSVDQTTATLNGVLDPGGDDTVFHFEYGTDTNYGSRTDDVDAGSGTAQQIVSADVLGLSPGTTYYFRLVATNSSGTTTDMAGTSLTTAAVPQQPAPQATTTPASRVGRHGATLNGVVDPEGAVTTYLFQYGRTSGYGRATTVRAAGSGTANEAVRAVLSGLPRHTLFHFRVVAVSASGTSYGQDRILRTK